MGPRVPAAAGGDFPELPDGTPLPFGPGNVPELSESDYEHFVGVDGTGRGGHKAGSGIEGATEFPPWVQTLEDLQLVHDTALANVARVQRGRYGRYDMRSAVYLNNTAMVVHIVLEEDGLPVTLYPINGDFVVKTVRGKRVRQPLNYDALLGWLS
jgi:hypothetical protein